MIKRLLSIRLRAMLFGSLGGRDKNGNYKSLSKGKMIGFVSLFIFLAAMFSFASFAMSFGSAMVMVPLGGGDVFFGLTVLITFTVIFILSIFETKSELFECKDNDLLMSLPINPVHIVVSRLFSVLILNYAVAAIVLIPATVGYMICGGDIICIFGSLYILLTLPLAATALSAGVGYLVAEISKRIKSKTLFTVLLSIVFLSVYFVFYFVFLSSMDSMVENEEQIISDILEKMRPLGVIGAVSRFSLASTVIYTAIIALVSSIALYVISKNYRRIVMSTSASASKKYSATHVERRGILSALCAKELRRFFSSANYILNGGLGVLFAVALTLLIAFNSGELFSQGIISVDGELVLNVSALFAPVGISIVIICFSMNTASAAAVSLEGENLWTLKSLPVSSADALLAKCVPHIILNAPISSVCGLILAIAFRVDAVYYLLYIFTPFAVNILFAFAGVLINVMFPKFNFTNEIQVIKQSLAVFLSIVFNFVITLGIFFVAVIGAIGEFGLVTSILTLAVILILDVIAYVILIGPAAKRFSKLVP